MIFIRGLAPPAKPHNFLIRSQGKKGKPRLLPNVQKVNYIIHFFPMIILSLSFYPFWMKGKLEWLVNSIIKTHFEPIFGLSEKFLRYPVSKIDPYE